jgi:Biotin-requiring enzyme
MLSITHAAHIVSLLLIPKMRPFGRAHVFSVFILNTRDIAKCEVIRWYVRIEPFPLSSALKHFRFINGNVYTRSTISMFDTLCEVQSDKTSVETTSPYEGGLKEILVQEGQVLRSTKKRPIRLMF